MFALRRILALSLAASFAAVGCVPNNTRLAQYIEDSHGFQCPPDQIRVLSQQRIGSDELFAVEACGRRVEVENGLEFPKNKSEVTVVSDAEAEELERSLPLTVTPSQLAAAREKAKEYCVLGAETAGDDRLAIYSPTPEGLAECRARVANATSALGADQGRDGERRDWFRVLNWAFPVRTGAHLPTCSRLVLADSEEACACRPLEQRAVACTRSSPAETDGGAADAHATMRNDEARRSQPKPRASRVLPAYGRGGVGLGYLHSKAAGEPAFTSLTLDLEASAGLRFSPYFAAGIEGAARLALEQQRHEVSFQGSAVSHDVSVGLFEASAFATWFPGASGVHLDGYAGICLLRRAVPGDSDSSTLAGAIFGAGLGYLGRGQYVDLGFGGRTYLAAASKTSNYGGALLVEIALHGRRPEDVLEGE